MDNYFSFFAGKRVLVTGDTGFKGAWLCLWLKDLGAEVVGFALPPERPHDLYRVIGLEKLIHHVEGDIRDEASLRQVFDGFQPELFFHLAAQALVRRSYKEPKLTFDTNVGGSVNVLEAVRRTPSLRAVIYVTSDKCYKNREWVWGYRENDELGGHDPYSASKAAAEMVMAGYWQSFFAARPGLGVASVRAGNVLGGGDWAEDRVVPDIIRDLMERRPVTLHHPEATRPWQHVLEPLGGYLLLTVRLFESPKEFSGAWNFGPSGEGMRSVHQLAEEIIAGWGEGAIRVEKQADAPHEAGMLHLNCDKARRRLGWRPKWDFARTVAETVRWYKGYHHDEPPLALSRSQINNYMGSDND